MKEELRVPVQLFKPIKLFQAINTTKILESTLDIWGKKNKFDELNQHSPILIRRRRDQVENTISTRRKRRKKELKLTPHIRRSLMLSTKKEEH